ncbi:HAD-IA family hydrolase [Streptomyces kunmingensis]|uniref:HAD-IA family hydrolase n=1 Tax=Streptomyces kunmingensis TaxID=68225 RepID=A0ABU6CKA4_9ACTN|nr:HAD-IA family hydrolase [Streptomyces kunmingensis]MEB3965052.1 HAD-IA family hydrolase [Streptomyces kunmingensis]
MPMSHALPFDAVLCDLDGVIRFYDTAEVTRLEREAGLPEGTTAAIGYAPETDLPLLLGQITRAQWTRTIAQGLGSHVSSSQAQALAHAFAGAGSRADEAVVGLLRQVRERCPLVVVTNAPVWLDDDLAVLGLADLADSVVNSSLVGVAKPHRRIYEIAAEQAGARPDRCLFVDDRQENVDAAREIGMATVLYRAVEDLKAALAPVL